MGLGRPPAALGAHLWAPHLQASPAVMLQPRHSCLSAAAILALCSDTCISLGEASLPRAAALNPSALPLQEGAVLLCFPCLDLPGHSEGFSPHYGHIV